MYRNMAQLYRNNQIIDVTKECTFEWLQEPDSITYGTFPDSIISNNLDDFIEGQTTTTGAGYLAKLIIKLPKTKFCFPAFVFGRGSLEDTDTYMHFKMFRYIGNSPKGEGCYSTIVQSCGCSQYESFAALNDNSGYPVGFAGRFDIYIYVGNAGTFNFRIYNIKILEFLV